MGKPYAHYIRRVGRALELPRRQKRALLDGLRLELEERTPSETELDRPEAVAEELLSTYDSAALADLRQKRLIMRRSVMIFLALLTVTALLYAAYVNSTGGVLTIETTIYTTGPIPTPPDEEVGEHLVIHAYDTP